MKKVLFIILLSCSLAVGASILVLSGSGGAGAAAPAGNSWTVVGYTSLGNGNSMVSSAGNAGDLIVVWIKWNGTGATLTGVTGDVSGAFTLRGTENHHATQDLGGRFATLIASTSAGENVTLTFTGGTASFKDIAIWRLRVTGTVSYSTQVGGTGTGTLPSSGPFTTATQNGIVLAGLGIYGAPTVSAMQVGGNAATATHTLDVGNTWEYVHATAMTGAAATATMSASNGWILSAFALSAQ